MSDEGDTTAKSDAEGENAAAAAAPSGDDAGSGTDAEAGTTRDTAEATAPKDTKADGEDEAPPPASKRGAERPPARRSKAPPPEVPPPPKPPLVTSVTLFMIVVGVLTVGLVFLGKETPQNAPAPPRWNVGQTVDVEITLVKTDARDLACASADPLGDRHCAFEAQGKPWTKTADNEDEKVLRPYTTTNNVQFLAAGLWSQPPMKQDALPPTRFNVKCKYRVDGKLRRPAVRWNADGPWFPRDDEWYAGQVSNCVVTP